MGNPGFSWYFPGDRLPLFGLPADGNTALVVPCYVFADGTSTPVYVANEFENAGRSQGIGADNVQIVDGRTDYPGTQPES